MTCKSYENLDRYEKTVGGSAVRFGAEDNRDYLAPDGGFVKNCMTSFVKDLGNGRRMK